MRLQLRLRKGLEEKLYDYYMREGIIAVIYICDGENLKTRIEKLEIKLCHQFDPKLYTINRMEFFSSEGSAIFKKFFGQEFMLDYHK